MRKGERLSCLCTVFLLNDLMGRVEVVQGARITGEHVGIKLRGDGLNVGSNSWGGCSDQFQRLLVEDVR